MGCIGCVGVSGLVISLVVGCEKICVEVIEV